MLKNQSELPPRKAKHLLVGGPIHERKSETTLLGAGTDIDNNSAVATSQVIPDNPQPHPQQLLTSTLQTQQTPNLDLDYSTSPSKMKLQVFNSNPASVRCETVQAGDPSVGASGTIQFQLFSNRDGGTRPTELADQPAIFNSKIDMLDQYSQVISAAKSRKPSTLISQQILEESKSRDQVKPDQDAGSTQENGAKTLAPETILLKEEHQTRNRDASVGVLAKPSCDLQEVLDVRLASNGSAQDGNAQIEIPSQRLYSLEPMSYSDRDLGFNPASLIDAFQNQEDQLYYQGIVTNNNQKSFGRLNNHQHTCHAQRPGGAAPRGGPFGSSLHHLQGLANKRVKSQHKTKRQTGQRQGSMLGPNNNQAVGQGAGQISFQKTKHHSPVLYQSLQCYQAPLKNRVQTAQAAAASSLETKLNERRSHGAALISVPPQNHLCHMGKKNMLRRKMQYQDQLKQKQNQSGSGAPGQRPYTSQRGRRQQLNEQIGSSKVIDLNRQFLDSDQTGVFMSGQPKASKGSDRNNKTQGNLPNRPSAVRYKRKVAQPSQMGHTQEQGSPSQIQIQIDAREAQMPQSQQSQVRSRKKKGSSERQPDLLGRQKSTERGEHLIEQVKQGIAISLGQYSLAAHSASSSQRLMMHNVKDDVRRSGSVKRPREGLATNGDVSVEQKAMLQSGSSFYTLGVQNSYLRTAKNASQLIQAQDKSDLPSGTGSPLKGLRSSASLPDKEGDGYGSVKNSNKKPGRLQRQELEKNYSTPGAELGILGTKVPDFVVQSFQNSLMSKPQRETARKTNQNPIKQNPYMSSQDQHTRSKPHLSVQINSYDVKTGKRRTVAQTKESDSKLTDGGGLNKQSREPETALPPQGSSIGPKSSGSVKPTPQAVRGRSTNDDTGLIFVNEQTLQEHLICSPILKTRKSTFIMDSGTRQKDATELKYSTQKRMNSSVCQSGGDEVGASVIEGQKRPSEDSFEAQLANDKRTALLQASLPYKTDITIKERQLQLESMDDKSTNRLESRLVTQMSDENKGALQSSVDQVQPIVHLGFVKTTANVKRSSKVGSPEKQVNGVLAESAKDLAGVKEKAVLARRYEEVRKKLEDTQAFVERPPQASGTQSMDAFSVSNVKMYPRVKQNLLRADRSQQGLTQTATNNEGSIRSASIFALDDQLKTYQSRQETLGLASQTQIQVPTQQRENGNREEQHLSRSMEESLAIQKRQVKNRKTMSMGFLRRNHQQKQIVRRRLQVAAVETSNKDKAIKTCFESGMLPRAEQTNERNSSIASHWQLKMAGASESGPQSKLHRKKGSLAHSGPRSPLAMKKTAPSLYQSGSLVTQKGRSGSIVGLKGMIKKPSIAMNRTGQESLIVQPTYLNVSQRTIQPLKSNVAQGAKAREGYIEGSEQVGDMNTEREDSQSLSIDQRPQTRELRQSHQLIGNMVCDAEEDEDEDVGVGRAFIIKQNQSKVSGGVTVANPKSGTSRSTASLAAQRKRRKTSAAQKSMVILHQIPIKQTKHGRRYPEASSNSTMHQPGLVSTTHDHAEGQQCNCQMPAYPETLARQVSSRGDGRPRKPGQYESGHPLGLTRFQSDQTASPLLVKVKDEEAVKRSAKGSLPRIQVEKAKSIPLKRLADSRNLKEANAGSSSTLQLRAERSQEKVISTVQLKQGEIEARLEEGGLIAANPYNMTAHEKSRLKEKNKVLISQFVSSAERPFESLGSSVTLPLNNQATHQYLGVSAQLQSSSGGRGSFDKKNAGHRRASIESASTLYHNLSKKKLYNYNSGSVTKQMPSIEGSIHQAATVINAAMQPRGGGRSDETPSAFVSIKQRDSPLNDDIRVLMRNSANSAACKRSAQVNSKNGAALQQQQMQPYDSFGSGDEEVSPSNNKIVNPVNQPIVDPSRLMRNAGNVAIKDDFETAQLQSTFREHEEVSDLNIKAGSFTQQTRKERPASSQTKSSKHNRISGVTNTTNAKSKQGLIVKSNNRTRTRAISKARNTTTQHSQMNSIEHSQESLPSKSQVRTKGGAKKHLRDSEGYGNSPKVGDNSDELANQRSTSVDQLKLGSNSAVTHSMTAVGLAPEESVYSTIHKRDTFGKNIISANIVGPKQTASVELQADIQSTSDRHPQIAYQDTGSLQLTAQMVLGMSQDQINNLNFNQVCLAQKVLYNSLTTYQDELAKAYFDRKVNGSHLQTGSGFNMGPAGPYSSVGASHLSTQRSQSPLLLPAQNAAHRPSSSTNQLMICSFPGGDSLQIKKKIVKTNYEGNLSQQARHEPNTPLMQQQRETRKKSALANFQYNTDKIRRGSRSQVKIKLVEGLPQKKDAKQAEVENYEKFKRKQLRAKVKQQRVYEQARALSECSLEEISFLVKINLLMQQQNLLVERAREMSLQELMTLDSKGEMQAPLEGSQQQYEKQVLIEEMEERRESLKKFNLEDVIADRQHLPSAQRLSSRQSLHRIHRSGESGAAQSLILAANAKLMNLIGRKHSAKRDSLPTTGHLQGGSRTQMVTDEMAPFETRAKSGHSGTAEGGVPQLVSGQNTMGGITASKEALMASTVNSNNYHDLILSQACLNPQKATNTIKSRIDNQTDLALTLKVNERALVTQTQQQSVASTVNLAMLLQLSEMKGSSPDHSTEHYHGGVPSDKLKKTQLNLQAAVMTSQGGQNKEISSADFVVGYKSVTNKSTIERQGVDTMRKGEGYVGSVALTKDNRQSSGQKSSSQLKSKIDQPESTLQSLIDSDATPVEKYNLIYHSQNKRGRGSMFMEISQQTRKVGGAITVMQSQSMSKLKKISTSGKNSVRSTSNQSRKGGRLFPASKSPSVGLLSRKPSNTLNEDI